MRKTEVIYGLGAGVVGIVLSVLSLLKLLPNSAETIAMNSADVLRMYAYACMVANVVGIVGALLIQKNHILGSSMMAVAMVAVLICGFPWQSISAVVYIVSVVMAMVPVKTNTQDELRR